MISAENELTGAKRKLFFWAVELAEKYDTHKKRGDFGIKTQLALANKLVFTKWRAALGGNISFVGNGGELLAR